MRILDNIIVDRGSNYAVCGRPCSSADKAMAFIETLKQTKKFAKSHTHKWRKGLHPQRR